MQHLPVTVTTFTPREALPGLSEEKIEKDVLLVPKELSAWPRR